MIEFTNEWLIIKFAGEWLMPCTTAIILNQTGLNSLPECVFSV
ncbi:hypothetical protein C8D90_104366 [Enterobacillus tribolii]|uniref:Uncharacterized protein n=1 Tax=Enterobacillus tribolii TaxID=1487935 RepID=A0A370QSK9_9GAMM|nr:hypothetical protein C8D90_104366 [Enterobacillus tribolii]